MRSNPNPSPKSKIQNPRSKIQNPKSKIQDPKSKIQNPNGAVWAATKRTKTKLIQNPKSKIQSPKSKIQDPKSKIQNPNSKIQTPKSKIQTPNTNIQNPNGPFGVWILDFGFGRAGAGGDGHVANEDVWPCWPPELGLVGGTQACNRKVAGSIPPTRGPNWAPISGGEVLPEIGARFPALCRGNRGRISRETAGQAVFLETLGQHRARKKDPSLQNIPIFICKHYTQILFYAIHNPWSNATNLPGRRLTGASLFKYRYIDICKYTYTYSREEKKLLK